MREENECKDAYKFVILDQSLYNDIYISEEFIRQVKKKKLKEDRIEKLKRINNHE